MNDLNVRAILHEEFGRWFGDAGPIEPYQTAADEVWRAVLEYRSQGPGVIERYRTPRR